MELKKAITERRSVRSFKNKNIKIQDIYECIDNSKFAPSSGNLQNWKVVVIQDSEKIKNLAVACLRQRWISEAPLVLVMCSEPDVTVKVYNERGNIYAVENVSLFTQNLTLLLHEKGLGSCLVASFDKNAVRRIIKIPDNVEPLFVVPIGYPNQNHKEPIRKELEHFVYYEEWGVKEKSTVHDIKRIKEEIKKKTKPFYEKVINVLKKKKSN
ncbi:MAG: nitroreductase family protein [Candidatus Nanoarchaeia archaeon]|nr:nitroreductase family protein [Candidatus Nanoarchaeia archaeon]